MANPADAAFAAQVRAMAPFNPRLAELAGLAGSRTAAERTLAFGHYAQATQAPVDRRGVYVTAFLLAAIAVTIAIGAFGGGGKAA